MKKYESIEIEVCAIKIDDVVTASGVAYNRGFETPWIKLTPDGEVH